MSTQSINKYYDKTGQVHTVKTERNMCGEYMVFLDGQIYACADDYNELCDLMRELEKYRGFTMVCRKKRRTVGVR